MLTTNNKPVLSVLVIPRTDLKYQVDAICEGREFCGWPNEERRRAYQAHKPEEQQ